MIAGDTYNEITLHWLDPGVDTGDIIAQGKVEILPEDTGHTTGHKLAETGRDVFRQYWPLIKTGKAPRIKQDPSRASIFNFSPDIAEIQWASSAIEIWNLVRSLTRPLIGAWTYCFGRKFFIWKVQPVEKNLELRADGAVPGQILAVTGRGFWVQTGSGQIRIEECNCPEEPGLRIADLVASFNGVYRVVLG